MTTSNNYNFKNISSESIISDAFELIGIDPQTITATQYLAALRDINIILIEFGNRGLKYWNLKTTYINLDSGNPVYNINTIIDNIRQLHTRTYNRVVYDNAIITSNTTNTQDNAGGGNTNSVFNDGNTVFTQNVQDGNITYQYNTGYFDNNGNYILTPNTIQFIGINSNLNELNLIVYGSIDGLAWEELLLIVSNKNYYEPDVTAWFELKKIKPYNYIKLQSFNNTTLSLNHLYYCNNINDIPIYPIDSYTYNDFNNKYTKSRPNSYFFNKNNTNNTLYLYPAPSEDYKIIRCAFDAVSQDVEAGIDNVEIIPKFYPALKYSLAKKLCEKYAQDKLALFREESENLIKDVEYSESENCDMSVSLNLSKYYD